jgi:hypothetical protein
MLQTEQRPGEQAAAGWSWRRTLFWGLLTCLTSLALHSLPLLYPMLWLDDFQMLAQSWTWHDTWANLWIPNNEHSMPLGRLSTWILVQVAGRPTRIPQTLACQGPVALLLALVLVYLLVQRETGQPFLGLLAIIFFGVSSRYQGAVNWFAATFALLSLDTILLSLLAAQRWRQTGRPYHLALSAFWAALAPGWFGSGLLAGPLSALYLLCPVPSSRHPSRPVPCPGDRTRGWLGLIPLAGTGLALALSLPQNAKEILNLPRVEVEGTAWQTFDLLTGALYTARSLVDMVPATLGVWGWTCPVPVVVPGLIVLTGLASWWWWRANHRRLMWVGLGFILTSYLLIYSGRAYMSYEGAYGNDRYHLFAHLGLVLFVCGGPLPCSFEARSRPRALVLALALFGLLTLTQIPRCHRSGQDPQQQVDFQRIEKVDSLCRLHHMDAETARKALPPFDIAGCFEREVDGHVLSGWDFLRGSDTPRPISLEQARQILEPPREEGSRSGNQAN